MSNISRRQFLKSAGVAALAVAASGKFFVGQPCAAGSGRLASAARKEGAVEALHRQGLADWLCC